MMDCLGEIAKQVDSLATAHEINHVAVEQTIYVQNFQTAQIMGAARGAASRGRDERRHVVWPVPAPRL